MIRDLSPDTRVQDPPRRRTWTDGFAQIDDGDQLSCHLCGALLPARREHAALHRQWHLSLDRHLEANTR